MHGRLVANELHGQKLTRADLEEAMACNDADLRAPEAEADDVDAVFADAPVPRTNAVLGDALSTDAQHANTKSPKLVGRPQLISIGRLPPGISMQNSCFILVGRGMVLCPLYIARYRIRVADQ